MILGRSRKRIVVWGLRARAVLRVDGGVSLEVVEAGDEDFVSGFAAALEHMPRIDFARRLWSGRLAEFLGAKPLGDLDAYRLDVALRGLGFRRRAERRFRDLSAPDRARAEAWAAGVNAWIDQRDLDQSPTYRRLETRPRLVGASDALLLCTAPLEVDRTLPGADAEAAPLWAALTSPRLRAPGAVGDVDPAHLPAFDVEVRPSAPPRVTTRAVLDRDDRHLYVDPARPDERPRRLYVDRPNVAIKGGVVRTPWIRRTPEGWLLSDALQDADGPAPPTGEACVLEWPRPTADTPAEPPSRRPLGADDPWRVHGEEPTRRLTLELVPKRG